MDDLDRIVRLLYFLKQNGGAVSQSRVTNRMTRVSPEKREALIKRARANHLVALVPKYPPPRCGPVEKLVTLLPNGMKLLQNLEAAAAQAEGK